MADSSGKKTEELSLALLTVNGLRNRMGDIKGIISQDKVHVFALCETKLDAKVPDSNIEIPGFRMWRRDRSSNGGGVVLYVQDHIKAKERTNLMNSDVDIIWVQLEIPDSKPVLLGCFYRSPSAEEAYMKSFYGIMELVSKEKEEKDIFLMGDFNIDWLKKSKNKNVKVLLGCGLTQIVQDPTRGTTCIDHIYTNVPHLCSKPFCKEKKLITFTVRRSKDVLEEPDPVDELAERAENALIIEDEQYLRTPLVVTMADSSEKKKEKLSLALLTVNDLRSKMGDIRRIRSKNKVHVLAVCDTRLDDSVADDVGIPGFRMWKKDKDQHEGGVALYVQDHIEAEERANLMNPAVDIIWVEMKIPGSRPVLLGCCYIPESAEADNMQSFHDIMKLVSKEKKSIFLMGNFNIDWFKKSNNETVNVLLGCGLTQIVQDPTRGTTCIDHIYTNVPHLCSKPFCKEKKLITFTVRRSKDVLEEPDPVDELAERAENALIIEDEQYLRTPLVVTMADSSEKKKEKLSLALLTVNDLRSKMGDIRRIRSKNKVHVLAVCDTRLDDSVADDVGIPGFRMWKKDKDQHEGGVALYVQDHIEAEERANLMNPAVDIIWVEMKIPGSRPVLLGCCYIPESAEADNMQSFHDIMKLVSKEKEKKSIFLMGNFNIDWFKKSNNETVNVLLGRGLTQIVQVATRGQACIDHIYTNVPELCSEPETSDFVSGSEQRLITFTVK